ncbi:MAG: molybdopterin dinucleotide binding domain-containing protein [Candidatus Altiarchaeota archaeon]
MIPDELADLRKLIGLSLKVTLNTGSSTGQGKVMRGGKKIAEADEYARNVAVCYMNAADMKYLGLSPGDCVEVKSKIGSVTLRAEASGCPRGLVFVPKGPWINSVIDAETSQSGSPHYKGMEATVSATDNKVKTVEEIISSYAKR